MLRKSYDEDSEFQNQLNFAKHKSTAKKKLQPNAATKATLVSNEKS